MNTCTVRKTTMRDMIMRKDSMHDSRRVSFFMTCRKE